MDEKEYQLLLAYVHNMQNEMNEYENCDCFACEVKYDQRAVAISFLLDALAKGVK